MFIGGHWYVCLGRRKYQYGRPIVIYDFDRPQRPTGQLFQIFTTTTSTRIERTHTYMKFSSSITCIHPHGPPDLVMKHFNRISTCPARVQNSGKDLVVWFVGCWTKKVFHQLSLSLSLSPSLRIISNSLCHITYCSTSKEVSSSTGLFRPQYCTTEYT